MKRGTSTLGVRHKQRPQQPRDPALNRLGQAHTQPPQTRPPSLHLSTRSIPAATLPCPSPPSLFPLSPPRPARPAPTPAPLRTIISAPIPPPPQPSPPSPQLTLPSSPSPTTSRGWTASASGLQMRMRMRILGLCFLVGMERGVWMWVWISASAGMAMGMSMWTGIIGLRLRGGWVWGWRAMVGDRWMEKELRGEGFVSRKINTGRLTGKVKFGCFDSIQVITSTSFLG
ncbi:hypothetical protein BDV95DRAFT_584749 [Massariosphaeria phaeospora]|uniref:Uncharacterized protein n=1 Tax=Massariosphaeria phaeospora TaxID=100035 RepID=A0A7C8HZA5_9PLEO|nr:hypothetical protein BDV95DRAFT_584749 [Massariosphaeria phaeospora]